MTDTLTILSLIVDVARSVHHQMSSKEQNHCHCRTAKSIRSTFGPTSLFVDLHAGVVRAEVGVLTPRAVLAKSGPGFTVNYVVHLFFTAYLLLP